VVVSAAFGPAEVEARIEAFLQDFQARLQVRSCWISVYIWLTKYSLAE
jgi:hypothetical protein